MKSWGMGVIDRGDSESDRIFENFKVVFEIRRIFGG